MTTGKSKVLWDSMLLFPIGTLFLLPSPMSGFGAAGNLSQHGGHGTPRATLWAVESFCDVGVIVDGQHNYSPEHETRRWQP